MSYDKMEKLLRKQTLIVEHMDNLWETCQSRSKKDDLTYGKIKVYLNELEHFQNRFRETDAELIDCEDFTTTDYYKDDVSTETLDKYADIKTFLSSKLEELEPQGTSYSNSTDAKVSNRNLATIELPKISLMTFDGDRTRWVDFRETFKALVHDVIDIPPVKNPISPDGYFAAWEALLQCYDYSPRRMMQVYMEQYFDMPQIVHATSQNIYALLNVRTQLHQTLKNMADPATLVEYLITYSTIRALDHDTRQRWEDSRTSSKAIPTFEELQEFLRNRVIAIQVGQAQSTKSNSGKGKRAGRSSEISANVTRTNRVFQCHLCNGNHALRACNKFRELAVPQRQEQARKSRACYNCLGAGHFAATCPSQKRCRFCQAKHHTLLHVGSVDSRTLQTIGSQTSVAGDSTSQTD